MAQQVPKLSKYVDAEPSNCGHPSFGYTWQERVGDVRGFQIFTSIIEKRATITNVKNLSSVEANRSDLLHLSSGTHAFLLLPDEHVECVEVYYISGHTILGLRFHTDKRVSEWIGTCVGQRSWLNAPQGHRITALFGDVWSCSRNDRCIRVGAVFAKLSTLANVDKLSPPGKDTARSAIVRARNSPSREFDVYRSAPRAIVVRAGFYVANITVASATS
jgi:hypothetical protein